MPDSAFADWPAGGVQLCQACQGTLPVVVPDGTGGGFIAWQDNRDEIADIYAQRLTSSGGIAPGWPADALPICTLPGVQRSPQLASDGAGGAYLASATFGSFNDLEDYLQRFLGDGTLAPGWPEGGVPVCLAPDERNSLRMVADRVGGALVAWEREDYKIFTLRYNTDGPVPVAVAGVSAEAEPGRVRLTWHAADGASLIATVERRTESEEWRSLGTLTPDGTGKLTYEDRAVTAGTRYGYRLAYPDGAAIVHTPETWVTVPALRLALCGFTPNLSAGDPVVALSLASGEPAALELFDIHGRLVLSREVGSHGTGSHSVRLESRGRLAAGVYTVRLHQGSQAASARAVIIQ